MKEKNSLRGETIPRGISLQNGRYRVRVFFEDKQISLGMYDTLSLAKSAQIRARSEIIEGKFIPPAVRRQQRKEAAAIAALEANAQRVESLTLNEWVDEWLRLLETKKKKGGGSYSKSTVVSYASTLRVHVLPVLGPMRLKDITSHDVSDLLARVSALPSTRNPQASHNGVAPNVYRILSTCFSDAVERGAGGLTVAPKIERVAFTKVRPEDPLGEVASPADVRAMAFAMPEELRLAVHLAAWCALRKGEAIGLRRNRFVDLDKPERAMLEIAEQANAKASAMTDPKTNSKRMLSIPPALVPLIVDHLNRFTGAAPDAFVFPRPHDPSKPISHTFLDNAWREARTAAGRPNFRFHDLRHTGLTKYAQEGATLAELLHRGGHQDIEVALRYQHATVERDMALTSRLNSQIQI